MSTKILCSFCGRSPEEVRKILSGGGEGGRPLVFICDDCVLACHDTLAEDKGLPAQERMKWRDRGALLRVHLRNSPAGSA